MKLAYGVVDALAGIVGREYVLLSPSERAAYASHVVGCLRVLPDAVVFPGCTSEVAQVLRYANTCGFPVVQRGAVANDDAVPFGRSDGIVLALERMNQVLEVRTEDLLARVQPRVSAAQLAAAAASAGLRYESGGGGDSPGDEAFARDRIVELELVSSSGEVARVGRDDYANGDRFALDRLLMSADPATVITEVTVTLTPALAPALTPALTSSMTIAPDRGTVGVACFATLAQAGRAMRTILASGSVPSTFEFLDRASITAVPDLGHLVLRRDVGALLLFADDSAHDVAAEKLRLVGHMCVAAGAVDVTSCPVSERRMRSMRSIRSTAGTVRHW